MSTNFHPSSAQEVHIWQFGNSKKKKERKDPGILVRNGHSIHVDRVPEYEYFVSKFSVKELLHSCLSLYKYQWMTTKDIQECMMSMFSFFPPTPSLRRTLNESIENVDKRKIDGLTHYRML